MLNIRFVHPSPVPIGCTIERLADGLYRDGDGWTATEPKPTPIIRDAPPAQDRGRLNLDASGWATGDYALTIFELGADGSAQVIVGLIGYTVPNPVPDVRVSLGVAGR